MNQKTACYISCSPSLLRFSGVFPTHNRSSLTSVFTHELHNTFFLNARVPSLHQNHFGVFTRLIFMDRLGKQTNSLWSHSRTKGKGLHLFAVSLGFQRHPLFTCLYNFFFRFLMCCTAVTVTLGLAYTSPTETFTGVHRRIREGSSPQLYMLLPRHTAAQELAANLLGKRAGEPK